MFSLKQFSVAIILISVLVGSCSTEEIIIPEKLFISTDKSSITADGFDEVTIHVKNQDGTDCTSLCRIYINNRIHYTEVFVTERPGNYDIRATKGTSFSDTASVDATDPGPSSFTRKILCEDYTGNWCGHCPRVGIQLEDYVSQKNPDCIVIGIHNGDSYSYLYEAQMRTRYNVGGFPTVIVNRNFKWDENNYSLDKEAEKRAVLGLALETSIEGALINVKAKVKSDVTTSIPMKLVVMLVEDNLVSSQRNYGYWSLPDPINNYNNRNVLRMAATDIFGDDLPANALTKDIVWAKDFTFNAPGCNFANCKIIAFVFYSPGDPDRVGILNVQEVVAGQNRSFD